MLTAAAFEESPIAKMFSFSATGKILVGIIRNVRLSTLASIPIAFLFQARMGLGAIAVRFGLWHQAVVDPKENMVEILMMQTNNPAIRRDFENAVKQALVVPTDGASRG